MNLFHLPLIRWRLAQLGSHLVIALIALVVVGGATRVMQAGLACPDWPLCFGSLLPGKQMNVQVFLEWFHRLDAFLIGIALLVQFVISLIFRSNLPRWLPWLYGLLVLLVLIQGGLGALTVFNLLSSVVVTAHLILALTLVALMSALTQRLLEPNGSPAPLWWRLMGFCSLSAVFGQCLVGGLMATTWSSQRCLSLGETCHLFELHRLVAIPASILVASFVIISLIVGGWPRSQWPLLGFVSLLVFVQISLGILSAHFGLNEPLLTVGHQLVAVLLVASLSALSFRRPLILNSKLIEFGDQTLLEICHG